MQNKQTNKNQHNFDLRNCFCPWQHSIEDTDTYGNSWDMDANFSSWKVLCQYIICNDSAYSNDK